MPKESGDDVTHSRGALPFLCNSEDFVPEVSLLSQGQERSKKATLLMTGQKGQKPTVLLPPQHGSASGGLCSFPQAANFLPTRAVGFCQEHVLQV